MYLTRNHHSMNYVYIPHLRTALPHRRSDCSMKQQQRCHCGCSLAVVIHCPCNSSYPTILDQNLCHMMHNAWEWHLYYCIIIIMIVVATVWLFSMEAEKGNFYNSALGSLWSARCRAWSPHCRTMTLHCGAWNLHCGSWTPLTLWRKSSEVQRPNSTAQRQCWIVWTQYGVVQRQMLECHSWPSNSKIYTVNVYLWGSWGLSVQKAITLALIIAWNYYSVNLPNGWNPNWLHTTAASLLSHPLLQTVPHTPLIHTCTVPSLWVDPYWR